MNNKISGDFSEAALSKMLKRAICSGIMTSFTKMDMLPHPLQGVGWNYLSIPKLERYNHWSLGMDMYLHPTLYWACDYLSMLELKLNHVSKRATDGYKD